MQALGKPHQYFVMFVVAALPVFAVITIVYCRNTGGFPKRRRWAGHAWRIVQQLEAVPCGFAGSACRCGHVRFGNANA